MTACLAQPGNSTAIITCHPGRYASLEYTRSGLTGNKTLLVWAKANGIIWDRWQDEKGDAFRARYETYLTDAKTELRKTKWHFAIFIETRGNFFAPNYILDMQKRRSRLFILAATLSCQIS